MHAALSTDPSGTGSQTPTSVLVQTFPTLSTVNAGKGSKYGRAVVSITDNMGALIPGASVTGLFSGSYTDQMTVTTRQ